MQVDEFNDFPTLLQRYRVALKRLVAVGMRLPASSRLRKYESSLQQAIDDPEPEVSFDFMMRVAFALREIDEIIEIADFLPSTVDEATRQLVGRLPGGSEHPDLEKSAAAREAQYELYLGTVARRAGFHAEHGHPDLAVTLGGRRSFMEAKRPSSANRVDDRVRSAVHQIRRLQGRSVIALSLDQVIRPPGAILSAPNLAVIAPEVARRVTEFVLSHMGVWRNRLAAQPIDAVLFTARIPARLNSSGHLVLGTSVHVEVLRSGPEGNGFAADMAQAYLAAQS